MIRLAILDADTLYEPLRKEYGSYGLMFIDLLTASGANWDMQIYPVIQGTYPASLDAFDVCLITGSKFDSFADDAWIVQLREYVKTLHALKKPMVGVCFGHQLLAHALGGRTERSSTGWGLGVMAYPVLERPAFVSGPDIVRLIISHQDQVRALPADARLLMSNEFCPYAAFYIPHLVLALQGHPEFSRQYALDLLSHRESRLPADAVAHARQTLQSDHDGLLTGQWIRRFVEHSLLDRE
jgi:GMP synthase-like glutamine amidotransferase